MSLSRACIIAVLVIMPRFLFAQAGTFPDAHDLPPVGWTGPVFKLSQSYPTTPPVLGTLPWSTIDFKTRPADYAKAILKYAYDGNVAVGWEVQKNSVRPWYHAPWMHWGDNGREFIHGLTRERSSRPGELASGHVTQFQNWAVSVYNAAGGYTIGKVWASPTAPNPAASAFADGAVAVKLLFSSATAVEVPYVAGAPEWDAHIIVGPGNTRGVRKLRLLQIDIAVRDSRADSSTGWVFGTFQYDAAATGGNAWEKVVPVSLTWGNDPGITPARIVQGETVKESWINASAPIVKYRTSVNRTLGWASRANGPVDNENSSCLSCHSTAQYPALSRMVPEPSLSDAQKLRWFRNIAASQPFDAGAQSLDYSLQLSMGIQNFYDWTASITNMGPSGSPGQLSFLEAQGANLDRLQRVWRVARDEDEMVPVTILRTEADHH